MAPKISISAFSSFDLAASTTACAAASGVSNARCALASCGHAGANKTAVQRQARTDQRGYRFAIIIVPFIACDLHPRTFQRQYDYPVVWTRAANVYGPGQQLYRIIPRTILFILLGRQLELHGGGHSVRSFIHIDDVADATMRIATSGRLGETYHISTEELISIKDLVLRIYELAGVDALVAATDDRPGKDAGYLLDSTRLRAELDWQPKVPLTEGLSGVIDWIDENLETLRALPDDYLHKP